MEIRFTRHAGDLHGIEIRGRRKGPDIRRRPRETGPTLPHDLVHAVVESALGLERGFWAAVDAGATFDDFEPIDPTRHRRSGLRELGRVGEAELEVEHMVSWAHRAWSGQRTTGAGLGASPLSDRQLEIAAAALTDAYERWRATPVGGALVWDWQPPARAAARR